jgi:hypothetical protein
MARGEAQDGPPGTRHSAPLAPPEEGEAIELHQRSPSHLVPAPRAERVNPARYPSPIACDGPSPSTGRIPSCRERPQHCRYAPSLSPLAHGGFPKIPALRAQATAERGLDHNATATLRAWPSRQIGRKRREEQGKRETPNSRSHGARYGTQASPTKVRICTLKLGWASKKSHECSEKVNDAVGGDLRGVAYGPVGGSPVLAFGATRSYNRVHVDGIPAQDRCPQEPYS